MQKTGRMIHSLKGSLTVVLGFAEMLADPERSVLDPERVWFAQKIQMAGQDMLRQISNVVVVSHHDAGALEMRSSVLAIEELLRKIDDECARSIALKSAMHELDSEEGLGVWGDAARLELVVMNLIATAIQHGTGGTKFHLRAFGDDRRVGVRVQFRGGPGADSLRQQMQGSMIADAKDIGLYASRLIVEAHGGTLDATHDEGGLTSVGFCLVRAASAPVAHSETTIASERLSGIRIMVIGGTSEDCGWISREAESATVIFCAAGMEGLAQVRSQSPDVVLVHEALPDLNALDVIEGLRAVGASRVPTLLLTATTVDASLGIDALHLPTAPGALGAVVQKLLSRVQAALSEGQEVARR